MGGGGLFWDYSIMSNKPGKLNQAQTKYLKWLQTALGPCMVLLTDGSIGVDNLMLAYSNIAIIAKM